MHTSNAPGHTHVRKHAHATSTRTRAQVSIPTRMNTQYLVLFNLNKSFANAPWYYIIRILPTLFEQIKGNAEIICYNEAKRFVSTSDKAKWKVAIYSWFYKLFFVLFMAIESTAFTLWTNANIKGRKWIASYRIWNIKRTVKCYMCSWLSYQQGVISIFVYFHY